MNIFYLHPEPKVCASYHCDKHTVKMILEYAQLLSTAHHTLDENPHKNLYRKTHQNHPCAIWVRQSSENYKWLYQLFNALCKEYTKRYNKVHLTEKKLLDILSNIPNNIPNGTFAEPPKCMPDHCKLSSVIDSYKNYYILEKMEIAKWNYTETPRWFNV